MTAYVQNFAFLPFSGGLSLAASGPAISPTHLIPSEGLQTTNDERRTTGFGRFPAIHHAMKLPGFGGIWRGLGGLLKRLGARTTLAPSPPEEPKAPRGPELIFTRINIRREGGKTFVEVPGIPARFSTLEHITAVTRDLVNLRAAKPGDIEFKFYDGIERDFLIWAKWELRKQRPAIEEILKFARVIESGGKLEAADKARLMEYASSIVAFCVPAMSDALHVWAWEGERSGPNYSSLVDLASDYLGNETQSLCNTSQTGRSLSAGHRVSAELQEYLRISLVPSVGDSLRAAISLSVDSLLAVGMNLNSVTVDCIQQTRYILFARGEDVEMPIIDSVAQILQLIARTGDFTGTTGEPLIRIEFGPVIHGSLPVKIRGEGFAVAERAPSSKFDDHLVMSSINNFLASLQLPTWSWSMIEGRPPEFTIGLPASELIWPEDAEFVFGEE